MTDIDEPTEVSSDSKYEWFPVAPEVSVEERPHLDDDTALPPSLTDYFASKGVRLSWQAFNQNSFTTLNTKGIFPICVSEMEESVQELLKKLRFYVQDDLIVRGDCALCYQTYAAHEKLMNQVEHIRKIKEDAGDHIESLENELQKMINPLRPPNRRNAPVLRVQDNWEIAADKFHVPPEQRGKFEED